MAIDHTASSHLNYHLSYISFDRKSWAVESLDCISYIATNHHHMDLATVSRTVAATAVDLEDIIPNCTSHRSIVNLNKRRRSISVGVFASRRG